MLSCRGVSSRLFASSSPRPSPRRLPGRLSAALRPRACAAPGPEAEGGPEAGGESSQGSTEDQQTEKKAPRPRRSRPSQRVRDDEGRTILDERSVDFLVEKGFGDETAVESWMRSKGSHAGSAWPFPTVSAAWEWLEGISKGEGWPEMRKRNGDSPTPIVRYLVEKSPQLLRQDPATLERKWKFLQAPEGKKGLGLTPEEAAKLVSSFPQLLHQSTDSFRDRVLFLKARGVTDIASCVATCPQLLALAGESIDRKMGILGVYGLDPAHMLSVYPKMVTRSDDNLEEKLRFLLGALRLRADAVQKNPTLLGMRLDESLRPAIALLLQLGQPLPPPPSADGAKVEGGSLVTLLRVSSRLSTHLVKHGHPAIRSAADYERERAAPGLLAAIAEWEAGQLAEAERMGLIPARGLAPSAE